MAVTPATTSPACRPSGARKLLLCVLTADGSAVTVEEKAQPPMRDDLIQLFDRDELKKYLTEEELAEFDALAKE